jgi:hypothetical protein
MNNNWIYVPMALFAGALIIAVTIKTEDVTLRKEEWRCIKSIMTDNRNVDKVECILYSKEEKNNDGK